MGDKVGSLLGAVVGDELGAVLRSSVVGEIEGADGDDVGPRLGLGVIAQTTGVEMLSSSGKYASISFSPIDLPSWLSPYDNHRSESSRYSAESLGKALVLTRVRNSCHNSCVASGLVTTCTSDSPNPPK